MRSGGRGTPRGRCGRLTRQAREVSRSVSGVTTGFPCGLLRAGGSGVGRSSVPLHCATVGVVGCRGWHARRGVEFVVMLAATPHNNALNPTVRPSGHAPCWLVVEGG